ncbi:hypothetical protein Tco_1015995 [Tanacetum coccineum]|uniref:Uncharacterized protein n=1 Tax=Tanacetum coccineum TaxID=301880 RepID=A0ABQ5FNM2_9ASTR
MFVYFVNALLQNTMAEQNVPAQPPTRTDEQIVPRSQWLTIGKSNLLFNAQKIQKNPIFQISVDILSNTNFFQAFTASANVPAIYLQQKALAITPVNPTHPFELPPSGDTVIDFVNELGYPEPVEIVSSIRTNYVYQPWRAILSLLNQFCDMIRLLALKTPYTQKGEGEGDDADLERAIKLSLDPAFLPQGRAPVGGVTIRDPVSESTPKLHEVVGKGKAVVIEEQVAHSLIDLSKKKRTTDQFILAMIKVIHESSSTSDSERTESDTETAAPKGDKDQDEVDTVTSGVSIPVSDPEKAHELVAGRPDPDPKKEGPDWNQL